MPQSSTSKQEITRIELQLACLQRAANAVRLAAGRFGLARKVQQLLRLERLAARIEDHRDARLQLARRVLREHNADFAAAQLDGCPDRVDADALDELLNERLVEK